jgi:hypothetical protein
MLLLFVLMALMGGMTQAIADEHKNDGLARVIMNTTKDGYRNELEEAITNYHHKNPGVTGVFFLD